MVKYLKLKLIFLHFSCLIELHTAEQLPYDSYNQTVIVSINHLKTNEDEITVMPVKEKHNAEKIIVKAVVNPTYNKTGWSTLEVWTNSYYNDEIQAYWSGYAEGCLTTTTISQHWFNTRSQYCARKKISCKYVDNFLKENKKWIDEMIRNERSTSNYWWQVNLFYIQLEGLHNGYVKCKKESDYEISFQGFLLMNSDAELPDIERTLTKKHKSFKPGKRINQHDLNTAAIKLLPENKDLYVGHASYQTYNYMTRILKNYIFQYHLSPEAKENIPGQRITFSGYPGVIHSTDDFYTISSGLMVQQTTLTHSKYNLYKFIIPVGKVLECARVMVANRLAASGEQWSEYFSKLNSGTYNNQWMIVDYKKFTAGKSPEPGLLWVLEQLPGYIKAEDETSVLIKQNYWPSVNIPYFKKTFALSGQNMRIKTYGQWFSLEKNPRAQIFKRELVNVKDMETFMNLMRYNDYKKDVLSKCFCGNKYSASNAISVRNDLNLVNGSYPISLLSHQAAGSFDAKITNSTLMKTQDFMAVSGPTTGANLPVFKWSTSNIDKQYKHVGQPDVWNFTTILTKWTLQL